MFCSCSWIVTNEAKPERYIVGKEVYATAGKEWVPEWDGSIPTPLS